MWRVEADNSEEPSFLGIIRDISRRRQTEVELRQSEARLQVMLASTLCVAVFYGANCEDYVS